MVSIPSHPIQPSPALHENIESLFFVSSVGAVLNPRALSIGLQDFHNRCFSAKKVQRNSGGREVLNGQRLMEIDPAVRADVQDAISRFYTGRIGVRFLVEHHVSTMPPVSACSVLWLYLDTCREGVFIR